MSRLHSFLFIIALVGIGHAVVISSPDELLSAVLNANPGDTIEVEDGTYVLNDHLLITSKGTEVNPIFIKAKNLGKAVISGKGRIWLKESEYVIIEGFTFRHYAPYTTWLEGDILLESCKHVRITRNVLELNEEGASKVVPFDKYHQWVAITGKASRENRMDHNVFNGKTLKGDFILITGVDSLSMSQNDRIDHNRFNSFAYANGANGYETIRIGSNRDSYLKSGLSIDHNLFENCNGETEMISMKCGGNRVSYNTILNCYGSIVCRSGDENTIEGNFFIRKGDINGIYGGVRIYGRKHVIFNNYFENLNGTGFDSPLCIMPGAEAGSGACGGADCLPAENCLVVHNTWINCSELQIGMDNGKRPLAPRECVFANNIIYGGISGRPLLYLYKTGSIHFSANIIWPGKKVSCGVDLINVAAFKKTNPALVKDGGIGLYVLSQSSRNAIDKAAGGFPFVTHDMHGQERGDGKHDIGADEFSPSAVLNVPLTVDDVGPFAP